MTGAPVALRLMALVVAALAWLDPVWTISARERARLGIAVVESVGTGPAAAARVQATLARDLRDAFDIVPAAIADGPNVLISDRISPAVQPDSAGPASLPGNVSFVAIDRPTQPNASIASVSAPARVHVSQSARIIATIEGHGLRGSESTVLLKDGDLPLGRRLISWQGDADTKQVTFEHAATRIGPTALSLQLETNATEATTLDNAATLALDVVDAAWPVLVYEPRASWASAFVRRALAGEPALDVTALTRASNGIEISSGSARVDPADRSALERFAAIVIGAPELLTRAEVDALRWYVREHGGEVVLVPDSLPAGPVLDLLPASGWQRRVSEQPERVRLDEADAAAVGMPSIAAAEGRPNATAAPDVLYGAEWMTAERFEFPVDVLARRGAAGPPAILEYQDGRGRVMVSGMLDGWKHRLREGSTFDAYWRRVVAAAAARTPPPIDVTLSSRVVPPGDRVTVTAALRSTDLGRATGVVALRAVRAELRASTPGNPPPADIAVRLWPTTQAGVFSGAFDAPAAGTWRLTVREGEGAATGSAVLVVQAGAAIAGGLHADALSLLAASRGGLAVPASQLDRLVTHLRAVAPMRDIPTVVHPFRSVWWFLLFASCLGAEWWLRRLAGLR